jgi:hypothetical protein
MLAITARLPRGEAGYWSIMRKLDDIGSGKFTVADVEGETNVKAGGVASYLRRLVKAGYARQVGERPAPARPAKVYRLRANAPAIAPRLDAQGKPLPPSMRDCLWRAMRTMRHGFTAKELAFTATVDRRIPRASAERYILLLVDAGYLVHVGGGVYRLKPAMNTGPLAPAVLRVTNVVFDRNQRRVVGEAGATEVQS